jgi:DNA polymerase-4
LTLKVKYADFRQITRGRSGANPIHDRDEFAHTARDLLSQVLPVERGVRLLGLTLSALAGPEAPDPGEPPVPGVREQQVFDF